MRKILLTTLLLITMSNSIGKSFDDLVTAADIKTAVKELATAGDWAKLTQLEAFLNHEDKLTDSGYPMVDAYYVGFRDYIDSQKNGADGFALLEKKMSEWVRKFPDSPASHIALSEVLNKKGLSIRGSGYADGMSDTQWKGLYAVTEQQRNHLIRHKAIASKDPEWYTMMVSAAATLSLPESEQQDILNEGLARFPYFYRLYFNGAVGLLPRWGGSFPKLEAFLNNAASHLGADKSDQIYALNYIRLLENNKINLSYDPIQMNCDRAVRGIEKFTSRFPTPYNYSNAAFFATICGKKDVAKTYFEKVGDIPAGTLWGTDPESKKAGFDRVKALFK